MIRPAAEQDAPFLTKISYASKSFWNYPREYFSIWEDELKITPEYIEKYQVFVYELETRILAYYSVVELEEEMSIADVQLEKGVWLDHMFVDPSWIGKGIGRLLFAHFHNLCRVKGVRKARILADPYSCGFYEKMGCIFQKEVPSTIANRTTPLYTLKIPSR